jgi:hypothetical protein
MTPKTPLKIACTASDCTADLHCFRPTAQMASEYRGRCRDCGADVVDWQAAHARDLAHAPSLLADLPKELIRHHYWHMELPTDVRARAMRFRPEVIASRTLLAIASRVSKPADEIFRDGTQTPNEHSRDAQVYYIGMHAVACCCRKCMEYWHGIPRAEPLDRGEQLYFASLVWIYVCLKLGWPGQASPN